MEPRLVPLITTRRVMHEIISIVRDQGQSQDTIEFRAGRPGKSVVVRDQDRVRIFLHLDDLLLTWR
jgi:hypothetical protein